MKHGVAPTSEITPAVVAEHGLTAEEYDRIVARLGREPNRVELGIFSVMWSEHCSYKSTRKWLKTLPTEAPHVICGPGENAGVIDIGDGQAAIFKMESHNHPSYIEPFQGAATGVGGILRDVFTMGARPIANMNSLRFGAPNHPKTKHLLSGVVAGIGSYGNCVGVPTVGGECTFHPSYNGNILVNAMTVGIADKNKIFYSRAAGVGNPVVYVGSKTGRDGIHGATMASAGFGEGAEEKRPTVQVGDPFTEKLLIEACLELMQTDAIVAIQDMGAAGLTSSSLEMAGKGDCGIELELDKVPMRENGMTPYEIMLSESQERMLMVLKPEKEALARAIFDKWELAFAAIGKITDSGRMILKMHGEIVADLPVAPMSEDAPVYDRPYEIKRSAVSGQRSEEEENFLPAAANWPLAASLLTLISSPDLCSKRWIYEQYDHMVGNDTAQRPGGDAAIVRVHGTGKALAISTDCTPRYCFADPIEGGKQAVAESWRNLTAVGATPLAITNCLNFGNPEKPEIMGQLVGCIQGMAEACKALDYPVISGNVSLYNETNGKGIFPTPAIGGVGILKDVSRRAGNAFTRAGEDIILIGETKGHLGRSLYLREILGKEEGTPPPVDLNAERKNGDFVRGLIEEGKISACHDVSDGGLLVALAEMTYGNGVGAQILWDAIASAQDPAHRSALAGLLFGEDQARYIVTGSAETILPAAEKAGVAITHLGKTQAGMFEVQGQFKISVAELRAAHEKWLPGYMA
ncbi:MAG: phosphoribosylformylglycinamidine synthase subunit PurL [Pseudomonadota bacterium]|nr:phosphoribosylformylglycinamidine synthase subunit PurL [Pseudomonadota bacterium]MDE3037251.1 phosphoribosylformylglycinamidine synthase subunit PurL [Pseudomonadota bacterium]